MAARARLDPGRLSRAMGAGLLLLVLPLLLGAGYAFTRLPAAMDTAARFESAPYCSDGGDDGAGGEDCLADADYRVLDITVETGRSPDNRILVRSESTGRVRTVHLDTSGDVLDHLRTDDRVRVVSWHDEPVEVSTADRTQRTSDSPDNGQHLFLGLGVCGILLAVAAGAAGTRLRGEGTLPDADHHRLLALTGVGTVGVLLASQLTAELRSFRLLVVLVTVFPAVAAAWWYRRWSRPRRTVTGPGRRG